MESKCYRWLRMGWNRDEWESKCSGKKKLEEMGMYGMSMIPVPEQWEETGMVEKINVID